ncbi:arsenate-mycothiol transferase ArsC [Natronococcus wangiae]|uniref:arsenate-mycothiol transferase ArsC n=1 Tax=Natronococcus wangiae TaxID=3068275 RepID=UPI003133BF8E
MPERQSTDDGDENEYRLVFFDEIHPIGDYVSGDLGGMVLPKRRRRHRIVAARRRRQINDKDRVRLLGNAGRSQMATAFAEQKRDRRGLDVDIVTGGTEPAESVHDEVIEALQEEGIDISDRTPRQITAEEVTDADYIVTMGCSVDQFRPDDWEGDHRVWSLDATETREQRDEIKHQVVELFDELET